jgi:hypothetical protein
MLGRGAVAVRTMLFAFASLIGVGTMVAMEARTPPRQTMPASEPQASATVGFDGSYDTLTKADRLEINYLRYDVPMQPALPAQLVLPVESIPVRWQPTALPADRIASAADSRKPAVLVPRPRPKNGVTHVAKTNPMAKTNPTKNVIKNTLPNKAKSPIKSATKSDTKNVTQSAANNPANAGKRVANTERSKLVVEPCKPNALGSFLKALNLSSGCQT